MLVAVNIKGVFNTSNETKYEKDPPEGIFTSSCNFVLTLVLLYLWLVFISAYGIYVSGIPVDFNFYKTFWSLQVKCFAFILWDNAKI